MVGTLWVFRSTIRSGRKKGIKVPMSLLAPNSIYYCRMLVFVHCIFKKMIPHRSLSAGLHALYTRLVCAKFNLPNRFPALCVAELHATDGRSCLLVMMVWRFCTVWTRHMVNYTTDPQAAKLVMLFHV